MSIPGSLDQLETQSYVEAVSVANKPARRVVNPDGTNVFTPGATGTATHTTTETTVGDSATSVTLLAANTARTMAVIRNSSTARLYVAFGATATTASPYFLDQDDILELPILAGSEVYRGIITGIWASDAGFSAYIQESV